MYAEKSISRRRQYVILPARGLVSEALASDILTNVDTPIPVSELRASGLDRLKSGLTGQEPVESGWLTEAGEAAVTAPGSHETVEIRESYLDDGPKLAFMTATAERALRASNPEIRIVPRTLYKLVESDGEPASVAGLPGLFLDDFRRRLYGAIGATGPTGEDVVVGILDTGVDHTHPRLRGVVGGRGMVPGEPYDAMGIPSTGPRGEHGTHVAGLVGARGDPATGPVGIAPGCVMRSYRLFPAQGKLSTDNYSIMTGIRAAVEDGCHLLNLSFGGGQAREDGVRDAINYAWDNGVLCIAAAGNSGRRPVLYPAAHNNCVGVSALGRLGSFPDGHAWQKHVSDPYSAIDPSVFVASFSNVGPPIDFAAPGHALCSTLPGGSYGLMSGTSQAAPIVTGLAAVLLSRNPNILGSAGNASRSEAMMQMLTSRASVLSFGSPDFEGFGLIQV